LLAIALLLVLAWIFGFTVFHVAHFANLHGSLTVSPS